MDYKPCPFCGHIMPRKLTLKTDGRFHKTNMYYAIFGCDTCTAHVTGEGEVPELAWADAEKKWNRRV